MSDISAVSRPCLVCGRGLDRPMVFRNEAWCSDRCRKVVIGEEVPTTAELASMSQELFDSLSLSKGEARG